MKKIYKYNFNKEWIKALKEYYKEDKYILSEINTEEHTNIIQMLNSFIYKDENIEDPYLCNVYEITGISLQKFFDKYRNKNNNNKNKGLPLPYVRIISKQILIGLDFIHRFGEIIHNNLNMDNILICLTKNELETIQETGNIYLEEENILDNKIIKDLNDNTQKIMRQCEQRIIKRQEKQMEKMGLSPIKKDINKNLLGNNKNININIDEIYEELNDQYKNNNYEYNINDLISRPRVASIPKEDIKNNKYNFNIDNYSNKIQTYIKEKHKIKYDDEYRKNILIKKNLLEQFNNKIEIFKKINKESVLNGPSLNSDIKIKIAEFNNFIKLSNKDLNINSNLIQKEKYLSPEIILNTDYNETLDIWALACIIFELATGEPLFEAKKEENFSKYENHILKYIELLGNIPKKIISRMKNPKIYYDLIKKLQKSKKLERISIKELLIMKYNFKKEEAETLNDFLSQMLEYFPEKRASAKKMLEHPWLNMQQNFDYISNKENNNVLNNKNEEIIYDSNESNCEEYMADSEDNDKGEIYNEFKDEEDSGDDNPDKIIIPNYNNSFAEYGQFIDLTSLDKANPQFDEIMNQNGLE